MSIVTKFAFWSRPTIETRIDVDSEGVSVHNPGLEHAPRTYPWSDFSKIHETDFGIELRFKRRPYGVGVPWVAFIDPEQQAEFQRIVELHLPCELDEYRKEKTLT